ncbi:MAG: hypothetical protein AAGF93_10635, partial [Cyanobacteria bacterium P01_H01_bin.105]
TNRGSQSISAHGKGLEKTIKLGTSRLLLYIQLFVFGICLFWLTGNLNPVWDIAGLRLTHQTTTYEIVQMVDAMDHGVWPSDGQDDSPALQALIDELSQGSIAEQPIELILPIGELDLLQPVNIGRGQLTLRGQGPGRTVLAARFDRAKADAVLQVRPEALGGATLEQVHFTGFTLQSIDMADVAQLDGILMEQVVDSSVSNLAIASNIREPLTLDQTDNISIEQVAIHNRPNRPNLALNQT